MTDGLQASIGHMRIIVARIRENDSLEPAERDHLAALLDEQIAEMEARLRAPPGAWS